MLGTEKTTHVMELVSAGTTPAARYVDYFTQLFDKLTSDLDVGPLETRAVCDYIERMVADDFED